MRVLTTIILLLHFGELQSQNISFTKTDVPIGCFLTLDIPPRLIAYFKRNEALIEVPTKKIKLFGNNPEKKLILDTMVLVEGSDSAWYVFKPIQPQYSTVIDKIDLQENTHQFLRKAKLSKILIRIDGLTDKSGRDNEIELLNALFELFSQNGVLKKSFSVTNASFREMITILDESIVPGDYLVVPCIELCLNGVNIVYSKVSFSFIFR